MNKEYFKKNQPIVYQTLSNALKRNRLAHAYLFEGDKGSPKLDVAILFAQSLVCSNPDEDGFACQECDACKRLKNKESADFKWIGQDGEKIKKEDIVKLQEFFESTSIEEQDKRIYILEGFDYCTASASNSLLKFLEEPAQGIYGILTADEKSNILPTIQSRCQWIHFKPASKQDMINELENLCDKEVAKILTESGYTLDKAKELLEHEEFNVIKDAAYTYASKLDSMNEVFRLQSEVFVNKSNLMKKEWIRLWLECLLFNIRNNRDRLSFEKQVEVQTILIESMDILRRPVDLGLFLDKIYYDIRKVVIE